MPRLVWVLLVAVRGLRHTPGCGPHWSLDAGAWTLEPGRWSLDAGAWSGGLHAPAAWRGPSSDFCVLGPRLTLWALALLSRRGASPVPSPASRPALGYDLFSCIPTPRTYCTPPVPQPRHTTSTTRDQPPNVDVVVVEAQTVK